MFAIEVSTMKPSGQPSKDYLATTSTPERHRRAKAGRSRARQAARRAIARELRAVRP